MCACAVHVLYFILVQLPTLDRRQFGIALIYKLSPMLLVLFSVVIAATTAARCHHFMNQTKPIKNNSIRFDSMPFVRVVVFASYKLYELFVCMHARFGFFCLCCRFRLIYAYCIVALKFYAINKFPKQYTTNTHEVDTTPHDPLALWFRLLPFPLALCFVSVFSSFIRRYTYQINHKHRRLVDRIGCVCLGISYQQICYCSYCWFPYR